MDNTSLLLSSILILIPILISYKEKLFLEKEIFISVLRAVVQLSIVGYLLEFLFNIDNPIYIILIVLVMIINASINTKNKRGLIKNSFFVSFLSISVGTSITVSVLVLSGVIKFTPNEIVPICGMIVSNSMVAVGLNYRSLNNEFKNKRFEVEIKLSLGANIKEASKEILRESIKMSITPTIDSAKTLGIVSLPGMMTGLILGGVSPLLAIKYQIMVTFMILSSSIIAILICSYMSYKSFFNERMQLNLN